MKCKRLKYNVSYPYLQILRASFLTASHPPDWLHYQRIERRKLSLPRLRRIAVRNNELTKYFQLTIAACAKACIVC